MHVLLPVRPENIENGFSNLCSKGSSFDMYVLNLGLKVFALQRSMSKLAMYNGDKVYNL